MPDRGAASETGSITFSRSYPRAVEPGTRVRMQDVARAAGVSVATVSKVINGRYGVSRETFDRVSTVIDELGYATSIVAQSLRSQRTNVIGVLVAEFEPFSTELLKGVWESVVRTDYEMLAYSGGHRGGSVGWERRSLARLGGTLIDGAIVVTPTVVDASTTVPVVVVDPHTGPQGVPTVVSDNFAGAVTATEYLLGLGHRRIALLGGRADLESGRLREAGFRHAMRQAGVQVDETLMRIGGFRPESSEAPARELLTMPAPPTAIFAANDLSAIRTVQVAQDLGLDVPHDVSVIGFDDVPEAALTTPGLTTIAQPLHELGNAAAMLLLDILSGRTPASTHVQLPTRLVERASCAPVR